MQDDNQQCSSFSFCVLQQYHYPDDSAPPTDGNPRLVPVVGSRVEQNTDNVQSTFMAQSTVTPVEVRTGHVAVVVVVMMMMMKMMKNAVDDDIYIDDTCKC